jgi:hypothetical protein
MRKLLGITAIAAIADMAVSAAASAGPLPPPAPQLPSTGGGESGSSKARTMLHFDGAFMTNGASVWSGKITSSNANCANKRLVLIYKQRSGADKKIASTKAKRSTGAVGHYWAFEKVGFAVKSSERYYAKVTATSKCMGARSKVLNAVSY